MTICVAICTRYRASELEECLASVFASALVDQVVVSSDGTDAATDAVCADAARNFSNFSYLRGPQRGLAANRNVCVAATSTDYLLFLDDDARLSPSFLPAALPIAGDGHLVTGWEDRSGERVTPHEPDFLGLQRVEPRIPLRAIVINATVFPSAFLRDRPFDEFYEFGSEEVDIAFAAVAHGLRILQVDAGNEHRHVPQSRSGNSLRILRSKIYFGVRRFTCYQPSLLRLGAFVVYAAMNGVGHQVKEGGVRAGVAAARGVASAAAAGWHARRFGAAAPTG